MQSRTGRKPLWEIQVNETIQLIRQRSKSRWLKSSSVYDCFCIFIAGYLRKRQLAYQTVRNHYRHLSLFHRWLERQQPGTPISEKDASCIQRYFVYLNDARHYKKFSLEIVQVVLNRFFHSMRLRRLIDANPVQRFNIQARHRDRIQRVPSPFELMQLLRGVNDHCRYLVERKSSQVLSVYSPKSANVPAQRILPTVNVSEPARERDPGGGRCLRRTLAHEMALSRR